MSVRRCPKCGGQREVESLGEQLTLGERVAVRRFTCKVCNTTFKAGESLKCQNITINGSTTAEGKIQCKCGYLMTFTEANNAYPVDWWTLPTGTTFDKMCPQCGEFLFRMQVAKYVPFFITVAGKVA